MLILVEFIICLIPYLYQLQFEPIQTGGQEEIHLLSFEVYLVMTIFKKICEEIYKYLLILIQILSNTKFMRLKILDFPGFGACRAKIEGAAQGLIPEPASILHATWYSRRDDNIGTYILFIRRK